MGSVGWQEDCRCFPTFWETYAGHQRRHRCLEIGGKEIRTYRPRGDPAQGLSFVFSDLTTKNRYLSRRPFFWIRTRFLTATWYLISWRPIVRLRSDTLCYVGPLTPKENRLAVRFLRGRNSTGTVITDG